MSNGMQTTRQMAEFTHSLGYDDIGAGVIERTKQLALNALGSVVLGANMDVTRCMRDYARSSGGEGEIGVIGTAYHLPVEWAAAINCIASHSTELEDVAWPEAQYTCFLFPAIFSLGEKLKSSGKQILAALVAGFEAAARPGVILADGGAVRRGWLYSSQGGTLGAAAAAAKLLGLDVDQTGHAISLAASMASGLNRQTGSGAHVIEAGFAGRNGIMAALLAQAGLTGNRILEGKGGFWDALAGQPEIAFSWGSGHDFRIMAVGMKKYPCCYLLQRIIDAVLALKQLHGVSAAMVETVEIEVNGFFPRLLKYPAPENGEEMRFSLQHSVASALRGDTMFVDSFTTEQAKDPELVALREKVRMIVHPEWGFENLGEQDIVRMNLQNGRSFEVSCRSARGDAENPLTQEELVQRFGQCTENILGSSQTARAAEMILTLESVENVGQITRLMTL